MAALPYMQLYVADYLADTAHLTTEEHGAYLLMLFSYWQTGKPLRADRLASVSRLSNERWTNVEQTLKEFFHVKNGVWTHFRVESDLEKVASKSRKNSDAGKSSARARAIAKQQLEDDEETNVPTNVATNVQRTYQRKVNHARSGDTDTDTDTEADQDQQPREKKSKQAPKKKTAFELPDWIDQKAWDDFVSMRKEIKKPITENAKALAVRALEKLALQGHDPNAVLNQSTFHSWQGLFAIKQDYQNGQANKSGNGSGRLSAVDQVRAENDAAEARRRAARPAVEVVGHLQESPPDDGEWAGAFASINDADGKIVGDDGRSIRAQVDFILRDE